MNLTVQFDVEKDGRIVASVPELPGVQMYGRDRGEAFKNVIVLAYQTLCGEVLDGERSAESLMRVTVDGPTPDKVTEAVMGLSPSGTTAGDLLAVIRTFPEATRSKEDIDRQIAEDRAGWEETKPPRVWDVLVGVNLTAEQVSGWAERHASGLTAEERRLGEAFLVWHRTGQAPEEFRELFAGGPYDERVDRARAIASRLVPFGPHPDDMEEIRRAFEESERMMSRPITPAEIRETEAFLVWMETGEAPEDLREFFETGERACSASPS